MDKNNGIEGGAYRLMIVASELSPPDMVREGGLGCRLRCASRPSRFEIVRGVGSAPGPVPPWVPVGPIYGQDVSQPRNIDLVLFV